MTSCLQVLLPTTVGFTCVLVVLLWVVFANAVSL